MLISSYNAGSDEGEDFPFSDSLAWFLGFLLFHRGNYQAMLNDCFLVYPL